MSRVGSGLFAIGVLAVLGTTFGLGVMAGRYWRPSWAAAPAQARAEGEARPAARAPEERRATFYGELAPSPAAPPPAATPSPPSPAAPSPPPRSPAVAPRWPAVPLPSPRPAAAVAPESRGQFTVQVGAFRDRAQAEALRGRLAASGDDAYLVEPDGAAGPWRVRVGAYGSREAAARAAGRLAQERRLPTFITAR